MYGRVFLGNTDGRVYAYDASSGKLDWAVQTGAYVYASPAVANAPGLGPTIYLGSYDGTFYAMNARSGRIDWQYHDGGKISGSATIIGRIVYFANLRAPPHDGPRDLHRESRVLDEDGRVRPSGERRPLPLPVRRHGPVRARSQNRSPSQGGSGGPEGQAHPPPSPRARASEKRAATRTTPGASTLTAVHPPEADETQACPPARAQ